MDQRTGALIRMLTRSIITVLYSSGLIIDRDFRIGSNVQSSHTRWPVVDAIQDRVTQPRHPLCKVLYTLNQPDRDLVVLST